MPERFWHRNLRKCYNLPRSVLYWLSCSLRGPVRFFKCSNELLALSPLREPSSRLTITLLTLVNSGRIPGRHIVPLQQLVVSKVLIKKFWSVCQAAPVHPISIIASTSWTCSFLQVRHVDCPRGEAQVHVWQLSSWPQCEPWKNPRYAHNALASRRRMIVAVDKDTAPLSSSRSANEKLMAQPVSVWSGSGVTTWGVSSDSSNELLKSFSPRNAKDAARYAALFQFKDGWIAKLARAEESAFSLTLVYAFFSLSGQIRMKYDVALNIS